MIIRHNLPRLLCAAFSATLFLFSFSGCGSEPETSETVESDAKIDATEQALSGDPETALSFILDAVAEGDGAVLWQAMPSGYQSDVNEMIQLAGAKVDPEIYDKIFDTLDQAITVADKQKSFIFNTELGAPKSEEELERLRESWPSIVNLVQSLANSSVSTVVGLQSFDGSAFFGDTVSSLLQDVTTLSQLNPDAEALAGASLKDAEITVLESTDSTAKLEINLPGESSEQELFVRVEDRWVPQELSLEWAAGIADARAQLEAIDPEQIAEQKPQIMNVFAMVDGILAQIESAESQQQFDQALQGAMMPLMGLMMMGQGMGGSGPPAGPPAGMPSTPPELPEGVPPAPTEIPTPPEMPESPADME